jgi:hypothetical protein
VHPESNNGDFSPFERLLTVLSMPCEDPPALWPLRRSASARTSRAPNVLRHLTKEGQARRRHRFSGAGHQMRWPPPSPQLPARYLACFEIRRRALRSRGCRRELTPIISEAIHSAARATRPATSLGCTRRSST